VASEYLGDKSRLLPFVAGPIAPLRGVHTVADLDCDTASGVDGGSAATASACSPNDQMELRDARQAACRRSATGVHGPFGDAPPVR
jgi:hypothetical protein